MKNYTLHELRTKRMKTQQEVANNIGVTCTYLSLIECGKRRPSDRVKIKLAKEYKIDVADIFKALDKQEKNMKEG